MSRKKNQEKQEKQPAPLLSEKKLTEIQSLQITRKKLQKKANAPYLALASIVTQIVGFEMFYDSVALGLYCAYTAHFFTYEGKRLEIINQMSLKEFIKQHGKSPNAINIQATLMNYMSKFLVCNNKPINVDPFSLDLLKLYELTETTKQECIHQYSPFSALIEPLPQYISQENYFRSLSILITLMGPPIKLLLLDPLYSRLFNHFFNNEIVDEKSIQSDEVADQAILKLKNHNKNLENSIARNTKFSRMVALFLFPILLYQFFQQIYNQINEELNSEKTETSAKLLIIMFSLFTAAAVDMISDFKNARAKFKLDSILKEKKKFFDGINPNLDQFKSEIYKGTYLESSYILLSIGKHQTLSSKIMRELIKNVLLKHGIDIVSLEEKSIVISAETIINNRSAERIKNEIKLTIERHIKINQFKSQLDEMIKIFNVSAIISQDIDAEDKPIVKIHAQLEQNIIDPFTTILKTTFTGIRIETNGTGTTITGFEPCTGAEKHRAINECRKVSLSIIQKIESALIAMKEFSQDAIPFCQVSLIQKNYLESSYIKIEIEEDENLSASTVNELIKNVLRNHGLDIIDTPGDAFFLIPATTPTEKSSAKKIREDILQLKHHYGQVKHLKHQMLDLMQSLHIADFYHIRETDKQGIPMQKFSLSVEDVKNRDDICCLIETFFPNLSIKIMTDSTIEICGLHPTSTEKFKEALVKAQEIYRCTEANRFSNQLLKLTRGLGLTEFNLKENNDHGLVTITFDFLLREAESEVLIKVADILQRIFPKNKIDLQGKTFAITGFESCKSDEFIHAIDELSEVIYHHTSNHSSQYINDRLKNAPTQTEQKKPVILRWEKTPIEQLEWEEKNKNNNDKNMEEKYYWIYNSEDPNCEVKAIRGNQYIADGVHFFIWKLGVKDFKNDSTMHDKFFSQADRHEFAKGENNSSGFKLTNGGVKVKIPHTTIRPYGKGRSAFFDNGLAPGPQQLYIINQTVKHNKKAMARLYSKT